MADSIQFFLVLVSVAFSQVTCGPSFTPRMTNMRCSDNDGDKEKWGYVEVKPGAHMIWWLYYTTHPEGYLNRPWIIWLQGGPGVSGTGFGNFLEIGPLDQNLEYRETTWVQEASVLFLDQPLGTGYSYVESLDSIPAGIHNISLDLLDFLDVFLQHNPEFRSIPLYLFGESYGGKYAPGFAYHIKKAECLDVNLRGIALGNGLVSPMDVLLNYGPLLYHMGLVDDTILAEFNTLTEKFIEFVEADDWLDAEEAYWKARDKLVDNTPGLNVFNFMDFHPVHQDKRSTHAQPSPFGDMKVQFSFNNNLGTLMNSTVRHKLGIIPDSVQWGDNINAVYATQKPDVMKDVIFMVDWLLEYTDVQVNVYEGNLDFTCETAAAVAWINRLTWSGLQQYKEAERLALISPDTGVLEMFVKAHDGLRFYWNIGAGHTVPADTPRAALRMLRRILNDEDKR